MDVGLRDSQPGGHIDDQLLPPTLMPRELVHFCSVVIINGLLLFYNFKLFFQLIMTLTNLLLTTDHRLHSIRLECHFSTADSHEMLTIELKQIIYTHLSSIGIKTYYNNYLTALISAGSCLSLSAITLTHIFVVQ